MNPEVVLKRFTPTATDGPKDLNSTQITEESSWRHIRSVLDKAVKDTSSEEAKSLSVAFHKLQVNQELKDYQILGLETALKVRKKQKKKSTVLVLQQHKDYYGGAVFYSPRKIKKAQEKEATKQQEQQEEIARKVERKKERAAAARYQKQVVAEAKAAREVAKKEKEKEKKAKAERMAAAKAEKQQEREAAAAQKALRLSQKTSSTSQQKAKSKPKLKRGAFQLQSGKDSGEGPSQPPQKASRTQTIRALNRYSE
ncbi:hypothetical protein EJ02DRAFT_402609 [Clathrospora elynae]|uniref:Uncharacterized protein n=1 Tax=Clathrospora elynae TaxID=706981 RepID=A0A6A5SV48_9PLEO|nr:hypothetical protein EJ02DRAFT_402609 [Clathrospora elynae]